MRLWLIVGSTGRLGVAWSCLPHLWIRSILSLWLYRLGSDDNIVLMMMIMA